MSQATLAPCIGRQFFDALGALLAFGKVYVYQAGTTTLATTYTDETASVAAANPILCDISGRCAIWLVAGSYRFDIKTAADVLVTSEDLVSSVPPATVDLDIIGTAGELLAAGSPVYLSDGSGGRTAGRWFLTDADFTYASSDAVVVGMAPNDIANGAAGSIRLIGRVTGLAGLVSGSAYFASATAGALTVTAPTNRRLIGEADSATSLVLRPGPRYTELSTVALLAVLLGDFCEGRLTLTAGSPVTTADVTAATTIVYALYRGDKISLYDGTTWNVRTFAELSIAVPATTSTMYDVWVFDNAGTPALEVTAWTNDTTRATALVRQNGRLVKSGTPTRRYVGSCRTTTVSGQTEDSFAKRYVWNYYHRIERAGRVVETTDSWSYGTATWRQANGAVANQLDFVIGVAEVLLKVNVVGLSSGAAPLASSVGVGEDSTTTLVSGTTGMTSLTQNGQAGQTWARLSKFPAVGRHTYVWLEQSPSGVATTWYGDNGATAAGAYQSGISGEVFG